MRKTKRDVKEAALIWRMMRLKGREGDETIVKTLKRSIEISRERRKGEGRDGKLKAIVKLWMTGERGENGGKRRSEIKGKIRGEGRRIVAMKMPGRRRSCSRKQRSF